MGATDRIEFEWGIIGRRSDILVVSLKRKNMNWKDYFDTLEDWKKLPAYRAKPRIDSLSGIREHCTILQGTMFKKANSSRA